MYKNIAIITDVHGNYSALNAVLRDIQKNPEIDHIYCLGDLIGIGYETNEVLELLVHRKDISFVLGNHDEAIIDVLQGRIPYSKGNELEHHIWIAENLNRKFIPFLSKLPSYIEQDFNGINILFIHYHLNDMGNFISVDYEPTEKKLEQHYKGSKADVICFGHHHVIHHFKTRDRLYLNPSSLGCQPNPVAPYAILSFAMDNQINVTFRQVPYDNKDFILGYKKYKIPAADYILKVFHGDQQLRYQ